MYRDYVTVRPAWTRPYVGTFTCVDGVTLGIVDCRCGETLWTLDPADAQGLADCHIAEHHRPRFWLRKLARSLGQTLASWG